MGKHYGPPKKKTTATPLANQIGEYHEEHPFASHSGRFALDQLLRKHGFVILRRNTKAGETQWRLGDCMYFESEALSEINPEEVRLAKLKQSQYFNLVMC